MSDLIKIHYTTFIVERDLILFCEINFALQLPFLNQGNIFYRNKVEDFL
jgi:hypothetical protein